MIPFSLLESSFGKPFHVNSEGRVMSGEVPEAFHPDQCLGTIARNAVSSFSVLCADGAVDYLAENRKNKVILYESAILFLIYTDLEDRAELKECMRLVKLTLESPGIDGNSLATQCRIIGVCFARNINMRPFSSTSYHRSIVDHRSQQHQDSILHLFQHNSF